MGERVGCASECLDLLVWDFGEVAAEQFTNTCPVVLERGGAIAGQVDQDHAPVASLSVAAPSVPRCSEASATTYCITARFRC